MDFGNSLIEAGTSSVLNELLAPLRDDNGMAMPSRYEVLFLPPSGTRGTSTGSSTNLFSQVLLGQVGGQEQREVGYQCNSIAFPPRGIDTSPDDNIYGPVRKIANGGYTYSPIQGKFYCHNDMREKIFFETWQRLAYNPQTFAAGYYDDYVGTIQIYSLDQDGNRRYGCELVECFPTDIAEQGLDASPATTAQEVNVTFSYRYWKNLTDEGSLPKPLLDRLQGVLANQVERQLLSRIPKVLRKL